MTLEVEMSPLQRLPTILAANPREASTDAVCLDVASFPGESRRRRLHNHLIRNSFSYLRQVLDTSVYGVLPDMSKGEGLQSADGDGFSHRGHSGKSLYHFWNDSQHQRFMDTQYKSYLHVDHATELLAPNPKLSVYRLQVDQPFSGIPIRLLPYRTSILISFIADLLSS